MPSLIEMCVCVCETFPSSMCYRNPENWASETVMLQLIIDFRYCEII